MAAAYPHLFTPISVGPITLRNRIVVPPHGVSFLPGYGAPIDRVSDYLVERAKGGAAMITMSNFVTPRSWTQLATWGGNLATTPLGALDVANDERLQPAYRKLIERVHAQGAAFVAQLNLGGRQYYMPGMLHFGIPLMAPSAIPCPRTRQIPREMTIGDIEEMIESLAEATAAMRDAGADGVELFAAQGYLFSEFLSPSANQRTDRYGGSFDNRLRVVVEALAAIRDAAGGSLAIGLRLNGDDRAPNGFTLPMACEVASRLRRDKLVDYINVSGMTYFNYPAWIADMTAPEATFADDAEAIRRSADGTPVCVTTRIGSPEIAERLLAAGKADLIGMARALIADPQWPEKAREGRADDIRKCTYSNQSCSMGQSLGRGVGCMQNVAVGREAQLGVGTMRPAARARRVLVIGGGPAGLAAARVAAERGHQVDLWEATSALGGQNRLTASMPTRSGFGEVTRWQEHALRRLPVTILLNRAATLADILSTDADAIVLATGSTPRRDGYSAARPQTARLPGADRAHVLTVHDALEQPSRVGRRVALIDDDPHLAGAYVAEHLAPLGHRVTIITPQHYPARELHIYFLGDLYARLRKNGVAIVTDACPIEIAGDRVRCVERYSDVAFDVGEIDSVILAMGNQANDDLAKPLSESGREIHVIGDCLTPRKLDEAILDGERAGWMI
ncbi:MAG: hypothetical protein BGP06_20315 [Rhizobiales bacterium 65-9]|nr:FAD-dependent oxidoreductase [Hyphomicrobiales bacterium]OJY39776.1 MAG: hypothetical protein BGP06_20315 [Rhizobiales bacterium 65-9]